MTGFRATLRDQLVTAAGEQPPTGVRLPLRPLLAVVAAAAAVALLVAVLPLRREAPVGTDPDPVALEGRDLFGGSLEPGVRYRSRRLVPQVSFVVRGDRWFVEDTAGRTTLFLDVRGGTSEPGGELLAEQRLGFVRPAQVVDPLTGVPDAAPRDILGWLREHPDLRALGTGRATVAGHRATTLDTVTRTGRPAQADPECAARGAVCAVLLPGVSALRGSHVRWMLVETRRGPFLVMIGGVDAAALRRGIQLSRPVLASLRIGA